MSRIQSAIPIRVQNLAPMADIKELSKIGEKLGLAGAELREWLDKQASDYDRRKATEIELAKLQRVNLELKNKNTQKELELNQLRIDNPNSDPLNESNNSTASASVAPRAKLPPLPLFDDSKDRIEFWLTRFERYFEANNFEVEMKAVVLSSYLRGTALAVYNRLSAQDAQSYDKLKAVLLRQYEVTPDSCRREFRKIGVRDHETYHDVGVKLNMCLTRWLGLDQSKETYEDLRDLIIRDQLMTIFPNDLKIYIKEKGLRTAADYISAADRYREARKLEKTDRWEKREHHQKAKFDGPAQSPSVKKSTVTPKPGAGNQRVNKKCDFCGTSGSHDTAECFKKKRHDAQRR